MANFINCQFLGGWNSEQDILNNFAINLSDEEFFLVLKDYRENLNSSGILVYKQYGYYCIVIRGITDYDIQEQMIQNFMTKEDLQYFFGNSSNETFNYLINLTEQQRQIFFYTIENN